MIHSFGMEFLMDSRFASPFAFQSVMAGGCVNLVSGRTLGPPRHPAYTVSPHLAKSPAQALQHNSSGIKFSVYLITRSKSKVNKSRPSATIPDKVVLCIATFAHDSTMSLSGSSSNKSIPLWDSANPGNPPSLIGVPASRGMLLTWAHL